MTNKSRARAAKIAAAVSGEIAPFDPMRLPRAQAALGVAVAALVKFPSRPTPQTLVERVDQAVAEINLAVDELAARSSAAESPAEAPASQEDSRAGRGDGDTTSSTDLLTN